MTVQVTAQQLRAAAKGQVNAQNMNSVLIAVDSYAADLGMDRPHRAVQFYAQIMHESGDFRFDREIWGPTPQQARYDTRTDLGNSPAVDGDGKLYMGRTAMQLTGKANYLAFEDWCVERGFIRRTSSSTRTWSTPIRGKASSLSGIGAAATSIAGLIRETSRLSPRKSTAASTGLQIELTTMSA